MLCYLSTSEQMKQEHACIPMTVRLKPMLQTNTNYPGNENKGCTSYKLYLAKLSNANKEKQNKSFSFVRHISMEVDLDHDDEKKQLYSSPTSSPPTSPSPLPISVGPGNQKYLFSPPSSHTASAENLLPLLLPEKLQQPSPRMPSLTFSLDYSRMPPDHLEPRSSCLTDLLEWFIERCYNCCTRTPYQLENRPSSSSTFNSNSSRSMTGIIPSLNVLVEIQSEISVSLIYKLS